MGHLMHTTKDIKGIHLNYNRRNKNNNFKINHSHS